MVSFECDSNKMLTELNSLGNLVEKVRSGIDYKSKKQPLVSVCEKGNGMGELYLPRGVTVDSKIGNIYIADTNNQGRREPTPGPGLTCIRAPSLN